MSADNWRPLCPFASHYLALPAGRMHYFDEGSGSPVVCVHGNPTWAFAFRDVAKGLAAGHRVLVPDHLGCGESDNPDQEERQSHLEDRIEDLSRFVGRMLERRPADYIAHDWGGMVMLGAVLLRGLPVRRLVLCNTAGFALPAGAGVPLSLRLARTPGVGELLVQGANAFVRGLMRYGVTRPLPPEVQAGYRHPYRTWNRRRAVLRFVQDIPLSPRHPSWATVQAVSDNLHKLRDVPVLILWGMKDFVFTPPFLAEWRRRLPEATVVEYPDAGHLVLEDAKRDTLSRIVRFLTAPDGEAGR